MATTMIKLPLRAIASALESPLASQSRAEVLRGPTFRG